MKQGRINARFIFVALCLTAFVVLPLFVFAQEGLVQCDGVTVKCDFVAFVALVNRVITFIIEISIPIAALLFAYAGFLYMNAQGNLGKVSQAHKIFQNVAIGFMIILAAWLIVYTLVSTLFKPDVGMQYLQKLQ